MIILFTKLNGENVNTTDKNVLVEAAKNGEIGPDTVVTIDGMGIEARRIKGLVFGAPAPAPEPPKPAAPAPAPAPAPTEKGNADPLPKSVRAAIDGLSVISVYPWVLAGGIFILVAMFLFSNDNVGGGLAFGGAAVSCILNARVAAWVLHILEYIAVNVTKKDDK